MRNSVICRLLGGLFVFGWVQFAAAGVVVIDGTDSAEHGGTNGTVNLTGWLYMQKALENIGSQYLGYIPTGNTTVVSLGTVSGGGNTASDAINSAFGKSSLSGTWTLQHVDGAANITTYLNSLTTGASGNTAILYIPTYGNTGGDLDSAELSAINGAAAQINSYVAAGGGLFAQAESGTNAWGWLGTLLPGLTVVDHGGGGVGTSLELTAAGALAFPGLTNGDLSGGPWHNNFTGTLGGLIVLGDEATADNRNVILGQSSAPGGGGISGVPEPASLIVWLLLGGAGVGAVVRRRKHAAA
ncbi:MAG: hypothetical protein IT427_19585 [Pirellulales bacterium]|nr:hypothetical protein [Pirellulales bacterium]